MKIIRWIGSLKAALFLTAGLTAILVMATLAESAFGTPFAWRHFYHARWFEILLGLVGLNVLCAVLARFPFKKHQTGFLLTHLGVLIILAGALVTARMGIEGEIALYEGEQWDQIRLPGYEIGVRLPQKSPQAGAEYAFPLPGDFHLHNEYNLNVPGSGLRLILHEAMQNAAEELWVRDGGDQDNRAVKISLFDKNAHVRHSVWLVENDPENPFSDEAHLGSSVFRLDVREPGEDARTPQLILMATDGKEIAKIALEPDPPIPYTIKDKGLRIDRLVYYPQAKVVDGKIGNHPDLVRFNPAVEFEISDAAGISEQHTRFSLFPHMDSIHGGQAQNRLGLRVVLKAPVPGRRKTNHAFAESQQVQ